MLERCGKILVALGLSDSDRTTLRYVNALARLIAPDALDLVHVVDTRTVMWDLHGERHCFPQDVVSDARALLHAQVRRGLEPVESATVKTRLLEGAPLYEILRLARVEEPDLVITGRNPDKRRSGTLPERLARKAPCSVLVVPDGVTPRFDEILVPVDFSANAAAALSTAVALGQLAGVEAIRCLHSYWIPRGYAKNERSEAELGKILRETAEQQWQDFVRPLARRGIDITCQFRLEKYASKAIREEVEHEGIDLVVVGARGRAVGTSILLGGTTERLVTTTRVPVLTVKEKGSNVSLLDALLKALGSA